MKVCIMRGISGAGKSTFIKSLGPSVVVSADHFFMKDGEYKFDGNLLDQAHATCLRNFAIAVMHPTVDALDKNLTIVVDNTNLGIDEIAPYYALARAFNHETEIITIDTDPEIAALRNVHSVGGKKVKKQWEKLNNTHLPGRWNHRVVSTKSSIPPTQHIVSTSGKNFFTSDTHWNHSKIIEYAARPFTNTHEMGKALIENWNRVVSPEDTVYHLGDVALGNRKLLPGIIGQLNGRKILVMGNHDASRTAMLEAGFNEVYSRLLIELDGKKISLSHLPRVYFEADLYLCGHVHQSWTTDGKFHNVGVDMCDFRPMTLTEIIERPIKTGKQHRELDNAEDEQYLEKKILNSEER